MTLAKPTTDFQKLLYHQTFELRTNGQVAYRHTLLVNPEDMSQSEPARVNVMQTLGGAYVDDFGAGLRQVTISGITGFKARVNKEGSYVDGYEEFTNFRRKIYRNFIETNSPGMELYWYNWEDGEFYQVQPMSFRLQRNARQPLLYRYEFQFTCIRKRGAPFTLFDPLLSGVNFPSLTGMLTGLSSNLGKDLISSGLAGNIGKAFTEAGGVMNKLVAGNMDTLVGIGKELATSAAPLMAQAETMGTLLADTLDKVKLDVNLDVKVEVTGIV